MRIPLQFGDLAKGGARHRLARDAVSACLQSISPDGATTTELLHRRANALIFRCQLAGQMLAVKYCRRDGGNVPDPGAAVREFDALERIQKARTEPRGAPATPVPVRLFADQGVYAMTWVPGETLTRALLQSELGTPARRALVGRAATWLRQLHDLRRLPSARLETARKLAYIESLADRRNSPSPIVSETAALLARTASMASVQPLQVSWIHGDFKADNLLVTRANTVGLDCQLGFENTVVHDLATFLNHLGVLRWYPAGLQRSAVLDELIDAFPGEYDSNSREWGPALDWVRAYMLVQRVGRFNWRPAGWPGYADLAQRLALRAVIRRLARW